MPLLSRLLSLKIRMLLAFILRCNFLFFTIGKWTDPLVPARVISPGFGDLLVDLTGMKGYTLRQL